MSPITSHVLDTALGRPAAGVAVELWIRDATAWTSLASGVTNSDGRVVDLLQPGTLSPGDFRVVFDTGAYLQRTGQPAFYPSVTIDFQVAATDEHYHIPLLLSPFGYSTYRGS